MVVRFVGDVGRDERCGGGGGGVCCTAVVLVGRKQQNRFANRRELFGFRVTAAATINKTTIITNNSNYADMPIEKANNKYNTNNKNNNNNNNTKFK